MRRESRRKGEKGEQAPTFNEELPRSASLNKSSNLREYGLVTGSTGKGEKREKREEKGEEKEGKFR